MLKIRIISIHPRWNWILKQLLFAPSRQSAVEALEQLGITEHEARTLTREYYRELRKLGTHADVIMKQLEDAVIGPQAITARRSEGGIRPAQAACGVSTERSRGPGQGAGADVSRSEGKEGPVSVAALAPRARAAAAGAAEAAHAGRCRVLSCRRGLLPVLHNRLCSRFGRKRGTRSPSRTLTRLHPVTR